MKVFLIWQRGVTIIELFCVLALIGVMLTGTVMYFSSLSRNQAMAAAFEEVKAIIQVGGGYLNTYGRYDGFSVETVQEAKVIDPRYNVVFLNNQDPAVNVLMLPWTQQASHWSGVIIIPGADYTNWALFDQVPMRLRDQYFVLQFRQIPSWACGNLSQQMQTLSTPSPNNQCAQTTALGQAEQLEFIVPKIIQ